MRPGARPLAVAALVALIAACGTPPRKAGYYQDDGPPDRVPADIAAIPDAVPRVEPLHRATSKPYTALGRSYTPLTGDAPFRQRGMASWYGRQFHGNRTANGETYDMFAMTAAHPILPIPSYVRVTNVRSGRSVIVRVNDRGPFKHDRVIDLSYAAATKLGLAAAGTGEVEVERITMTQIAAGDTRRGDGATPVIASAAAPTIAASPSAVAVPSEAIVAVGATATVAAAGEPAPAAEPTASPQRGWSVQLGAFAQEANAEALAGRAAALLAFLDPDALNAGTPRVEREGGVYRVLVGATADRGAAQALARELEKVLERPTTLLLR
jgi:rare lipoprotein A